MVADLTELLGCGVLLGVCRIDTVHTILGNKYLIRVNLERPLSSNGVGGEVRKPSSGSEDYDSALFECLMALKGR